MKKVRKACQGLPRLGKQLPTTEWAFHEVPESDWEAATKHEYEREIARELGSVPDLTDCEWAETLRQQWLRAGKTADGARDLCSALWLFGAEKSGKDEIPLPSILPWLALKKSERAEIVAHVEWSNLMMRDQSPQPLTENLAIGTTFFSLPQFREEIAFHVDWRSKDDAIKAAFSNWLAKARTAPHRKEWHPGKAKTGPRTYVPDLVDLVILRGRRAGLTMNQTCDLMQPFLQAAGGVGKVLNPIQRARACRKAQEKIHTAAGGWFLATYDMRAIIYRAVGEAPPPELFFQYQHKANEAWANKKQSEGYFLPPGPLYAWDQTDDLKRLNAPHLTELRKRNRGK